MHPSHTKEATNRNPIKREDPLNRPCFVRLLDSSSGRAGSRWGGWSGFVGGVLARNRCHSCNWSSDGRQVGGEGSVGAAEVDVSDGGVYRLVKASVRNKARDHGMDPYSEGRKLEGRRD